LQAQQAQKDPLASTALLAKTVFLASLALKETRVPMDLRASVAKLDPRDKSARRAKRAPQAQQVRPDSRAMLAQQDLPAFLDPRVRKAP
jgi:hypothetical protein